MKKRKVARNGIIANFQFCIDDKSKEIFEGITINISPQGFGFLAETVFREGQTITITKHALPDYKDRKAKVAWVKEGSRYVSAGAKFDSDSLRRSVTSLCSFPIDEGLQRQ